MSKDGLTDTFQNNGQGDLSSPAAIASPEDFFAEDIVLDELREKVIGGPQNKGALHLGSVIAKLADVKRDPPFSGRYDDSALRSIDEMLYQVTGVGLTFNDLVAKDSKGRRVMVYGYAARDGFDFDEMLDVVSPFVQGQWFTADQLLQFSEESKAIPADNTVLGMVLWRGDNLEKILKPDLWQNNPEAFKKVKEYIQYLYASCVLEVEELQHTFNEETKRFNNNETLNENDREVLLEDLDFTVKYRMDRLSEVASRFLVALGTTGMNTSYLECKPEDLALAYS